MTATKKGTLKEKLSLFKYKNLKESREKYTSKKKEEYFLIQIRNVKEKEKVDCWSPSLLF